MDDDPDADMDDDDDTSDEDEDDDISDEDDDIEDDPDAVPPVAVPPVAVPAPVPVGVASVGSVDGASVAAASSWRRDIDRLLEEAALARPAAAAHTTSAEKRWNLISAAVVWNSGSPPPLYLMAVGHKLLLGCCRR